jgi:threonine/homoserine/homoserine lactone efflux protein
VITAAAVGFAVALVPLVLTPGVSFTLATRRTLAGERHGALLVAAGTATGILIHAVLATAGLSAVVTRSAQAFTVVKLIGAAYLVWLGARYLWRTRPGGSEPRAESGTRGVGSRHRSRAGRGAYTQALLGNVLNPKAAVVYLTLAPQFVADTAAMVPTMLTLAGVHAAMNTAWLLVWSHVVGRGGRWLATTRARLAIDRVSGSVLVTLGVRAALRSP